MMRTRRARAVTTAIALCLLIAIAAAAPPAQTTAAWTDAEVSSGTVASGRVEAATDLHCSRTLTSVTFTWTNATSGLPRSSYRWTVSGSINGNGTAAASATSVTLLSSLLGTGSGTFQLYAVGPSPWESTPTQGSLTFLLGLLPTCSPA